MRSLFSGIFKAILPQNSQYLRARKITKLQKNIVEKPEEAPQYTKSEEEIKIEQKQFIQKVEQEKAQLKQQYEQQFKKVEETNQRKKDQISQKDLIKKQKESYRDKDRKYKLAKEQRLNQQLSNVRYYSELELTKMIRKQDNPESLFRLYNAHKFTYTTKNLVHTLTHYTNLVKKEKKVKISFADRRVQTLIFTLNSHTNMLSNKEKTLVLWSLCKLNIQDDISEKLIKELIQAKQLLEFKEISMILWVMGKFQLKNISQINELTLEICLRLDDPLLKVEKVEKKPLENEQKKTDEELEFDDLEELLELPESKENKIEPQSLSMSLWSLGRLSVFDEDLLNSALRVINNNMDQFDPLMITNILYSFSNLKYKNKEVFLGFRDYLKQNSKQLEEQTILTLKTLLIALCKLKIKDQEFNLEITNLILQKSNLKKNPLSARFMSEIIYYLSKSDVYDEKIYNKMSKNVIATVNKMNAQDCSEVLYAFTKYLNQNKQLLTSINLICLRLIQIEKKLDNRSKDMIKFSLKVGNIQNKQLQSIIK